MTFGNTLNNANDRLQNNESAQLAVSFPYQGKLDLPQDVSDSITSTLNHLYSNELGQFDSEQHQQLADSIHMMYVLDQVPVDGISYQEAENSEDQAVRNNSLLCMIGDIPHSTSGVKLPLTSVLAFGQSAKQALSEHDISIEQALESTRYELSTAHTDEQIADAERQTRRHMKRENRQRRRFVEGDEHSDVLESLVSTRNTLDTDGDGYTELIEGSPRSQEGIESDNEDTEDNEALDQEETITQEEHEGNLNSVNDNLSVLDADLSFESIQERAREETRVLIRSLLEDQVKEIFKKVDMTKEETKEYIDGIMEQESITSMTHTLAHVGMEFLTNQLNSALVPGLNPRDATMHRAQLLSRFTFLGNNESNNSSSNSKNIETLFESAGVDVKKLEKVSSNFKALFPILVNMIVEPIKMNVYNSTEASENHSRKHETMLELGRSAATRISECFDNYTLTSKFVENSYEGVEMNLHNEAANFLSHSQDPDTNIDEQDERHLVSQLAEITDMIPDGVEDPEAFKESLKEVIVSRRATDFIETPTGKTVAGVLDGLFTRERLAKDGVLQTIVKFLFEFMGFEIPLDEIHDTIDASQTVLAYSESENEFPIQKTTIEENNTNYEYQEGEKYALPVGSSKQASTQNYYSQELGYWLLTTEDNTLQAHSEKADGTTEALKEQPKPLPTNLTNVILNDFNPLAFIGALQIGRGTSDIYSPSILEASGENGEGYAEISDLEKNKLLTHDLGYHVGKILTTQPNLNDQNDLVGLLAKRVQKAGWFDGSALTPREVDEGKGEGGDSGGGIDNGPTPSNPFSTMELTPTTMTTVWEEYNLSDNVNVSRDTEGKEVEYVTNTETTNHTATMQFTTPLSSEQQTLVQEFDPGKVGAFVNQIAVGKGLTYNSEYFTDPAVEANRSKISGEQLVPFIESMFNDNPEATQGDLTTALMETIIGTDEKPGWLVEATTTQPVTPDGENDPDPDE